MNKGGERNSAKRGEVRYFGRNDWREKGKLEERERLKKEKGEL